uniref:PDZ domain-containing protein n=1 Tax=Denticeps clupeoides TaxID=299321 RepID=A0AAY4BKK9_9TELE
SRWRAELWMFSLDCGFQRQAYLPYPQDNVNVFLKACAKLGLKEAQLFHPGDLQDLSTRVIVKRQETNRRLKNVLITLFWLGKKAQIDPVYDGPYLSPRAFEGLLGVTLTEALELSASLRGSIRDSGFADGWYTDRENVCTATRHRREDSLDSLDSVGSRSHSTSSENTLKGSSEGFESDLEADFGIKMTDSKDISYRRSLVITPKATAQFNQFLPSKDKQAGYIPAPLRKKRAERQDDVRTEQASTFSRSKSLSDILTDETPTMMQQVRFEDLQKMRTMIKESEDKWQDDLTKWKNRRRSVNSDIVKKKEEREQIELLTSSGSPRKSKTFKEMQEESSSTGSRTSQDEANCNSGPTSRHSFNTPSKQTNIVGQSNTSKPKENTSTGKIVPEPLQPISTQAPEPYSGSFFKAGTVDTKPSGTQVSSYLPRSYQRSDSARITSVVAPRPFGVQSNRIASLPRAFTMDESYTKRFNGEAESSRKPAEPSRYAPFMTEDEARSQTSSVQSSNEDRDDEDEEETAAVGQTVDAGPSPVPLARVSPQPKAVTTPSPVGDKAQESYSDMRMILNQKPNRGYDFGFQANWDSTGAHVNVIQPGSSAELCHLQVGDEILSVNGHRVADMSYEQWKRCLEEAQKQGNLVMDIRRHGKNNWGRDLPSLPFKSHKTINLTSVDPLGGPDSCFSTNTVANSNSCVFSLTLCFSPNVFIPHVDSEPISLKNLKRRSDTSSNRWSWDPEEERRRQEKWQKEQERLLQEKYKRDQEKLDAEWQKAQQEAMKEGSPYHEEVRSCHLYLSEEMRMLIEQANSEQENEERRRKETEQRRQQEEEKRMKEEQQRLDKERRKREDEQHLQEEKRRKEEEARRLQKQKEEEEERRRLEREKEEELSVCILLSRPVVSSGLSEGSWSDDTQKKNQSHSQAELERQQILQEMKKKTQLLTDSSWIRQRETAAAKEPITLTGSMRRGESLDNLDMPRSSWRTSWTPGSTSSIPDYSRPYSTLSGSTSYGGSQRPVSVTLPTSQSMNSLRQSWSPSSSSTTNHLPDSRTQPSAPSQQQRNRAVSGKKICTFCDTPLGKGAAMVIESLGLCYHLTCFKVRSDLGGSEAGAEVRIRNQQLYCNTCYVRFKSGQPTSM